MSETFSAEQHHNFERQDRRDLRALSFSELQEFSREVAELARISFRKIENGYENVNGQGVWIGPIGEDWYKVSSLSSEIKEFQPRGQGNLILRNGTPDKELLMEEIRKMIVDSGFRIIE